MKIRKKLFVGFGILFVVVMFFGAASIYYIEKISETAKVTLKNNYNTLTFTRDMRSVLDENDLPLTKNASDAFNSALKKQENNITESGENEATSGVRKDFDQLISSSETLSQQQVLVRHVRSLLKTIDGLNMKAIADKNNATHETVNSATIYLGAGGFITFLIIFVLISNFPGFIVNPLHQLADGFMEVSHENYETRLDLQTSEEFAELSNAFNAMAVRLGKNENINLTKRLSAESQVKILAEEMPDTVIAVNEKDEIIFINMVGRKILKIGEKPITGQTLHSVIKHKGLLKSIAEKNKDINSVVIDGNSDLFELHRFEIVVPNLRPNPIGTLQFSGFPAGMIYILKNISEKEKAKSV
ncbi:HAMP domain-containing protein [uncultured Mucilaginibacter sp.]|uniref:HAMP domain-containing protein n=1 Tax=uncultured Mucilaginibacter sp. TaxID=797541 RepID=UPI0025D2DF42|nr:HAMP domain-containing protein [uncultured Mucilaginibacter sp.]